MWIALLWTSVATAGPWVKEPGHAYVKAGYVRFAADEYVDPTGGDPEADGGSGPRYIGDTWHLYGEIGVFRPLQVVVNLPFVASRNVDGDVVYANRALGDAEIGLAAGHSFGTLPVSVTLKGKLPMYDNHDLAAYGYLGDRFPVIGDGQVDLTALVAAGHGLRVAGLQGWTAVELGYQVRSEWWMGDSGHPDRQILDSIPWHLQLGWSPRRSDRSLGWLATDLSGVQPLGRNDVTKQWVQAGFGGGLFVVEAVALELGASVTPIAHASSRGWSLSAGVSWHR